MVPEPPLCQMPHASDHGPVHEHARIDFQNLQLRTRLTLMRIQSFAESIRRMCVAEKRLAKDQIKMTESMTEETIQDKLEDTKLNHIFCENLRNISRRRQDQAEKLLALVVEPWDSLVKVELRRHRDCVSSEAREDHAVVSLAQSVAKRRTECRTLFADLNVKIKRVEEVQKDGKKRSKRDKEFALCQQRSIKAFTRFEQELKTLNDQEVTLRKHRKQMCKILSEALSAESVAVAALNLEMTENADLFHSTEEKFVDLLKEESPDTPSLIERYVAPAFAHQYLTPILADQIEQHYAPDLQYEMPVVFIDDRTGVSMRCENSDSGNNEAKALISNLLANDRRTSFVSVSSVQSKASADSEEEDARLTPINHSTNSDEYELSATSSAYSEDSDGSLPPHWSEIKEEGEHTYYWNSETEESMWIRPRKPKPKKLADVSRDQSNSLGSGHISGNSSVRARGFSSASHVSRRDNVIVRSSSPSFDRQASGKRAPQQRAPGKSLSSMRWGRASVGVTLEDETPDSSAPEEDDVVSPMPTIRLKPGPKHARAISKDLRIPAGLNSLLSKGPQAPPRR